MGKWTSIKRDSLNYCQGFLDARKDYGPRLAFRIVRSDGRVIEEIKESADVFIGQVAGWPTSAQYHNAAKRATERALMAEAREKERDKRNG